MIFKIRKIGRNATRAMSRRPVLKAKPPLVKARDVCGDLAWLAIKALASTLAPAKPSYRPLTAKDVRDSQLSFFWANDNVSNRLALTPEERRLARRREKALLRSKKKRRIKPKRQGLQYSLGVRFREKPRKLKFTRKAPKEVGVGNDHNWDMRHARRLHAALLADSLALVREYLLSGSLRVAEVWMWISRRGHDEPFAFDTCCLLAPEFPEFFDDWDLGGLDSEALRDQLEVMIRRRFSNRLCTLVRVLKAAIVDLDHGVISARNWINSDEPGPMSFNECVDALGFEPDTARRELAMPSMSSLAEVA